MKQSVSYVQIGFIFDVTADYAFKIINNQTGRTCENFT